MRPSAELEWIPTDEVKVGDRLACLLSDAEAYPEITGWEDKTLDLSAHGLGKPVHRVFTVRGAPWWVDEMDRTGRMGDKTLIVKRA